MDTNTRYGFGRSGSGRRGRGEFFKLSGLLALTLAFAVWLQNAAHQAAATDRALAGAPGLSHRSYFGSGRWLADARTLAAALRYLAEPEPAVLAAHAVPATIPSQPPVQASTQNYSPSSDPANALLSPAGLSTNRPVKI